MKKFITASLLLLILLCIFTSCSKNEQNINQGETDTENRPFDTEYTDLESPEAITPDASAPDTDAPDIDEPSIEDFLEELKKTVSLATIHVSTKDNAEIISREDYVDCTVELFNCDEQYVITSAAAGIRVRGNASAYFGDVESIRKNQVPYRIKFDKKQNLLGLNDGAKFKSWVLLKADTTLFNDYMAFKLGSMVLHSRVYCSDCSFVQVFVNKKYMGLYLLAEQNQVDENRVAIREAEEGYVGTDIGYLLEIDHYASEQDNYFLVDYSNESFTDVLGKTLNFATKKYSIKNDVYSQEQVDFIAKYVNNCFTIVLEASKGNYLALDENCELVPSQRNNAFDAINDVIDIYSVVNMYILDEIICDRDCGMGSFYMCVDFSEDSEFKKLTFVSPWDSSWAYIESYTDFYAAAFQDDKFIEKYEDRSNPWYLVLAKEEWFIDLVRERWVDVYTDVGFLKIVQEAYAYIEENISELNRQYPDATNGGIALLGWVEERMKWLNGMWGVGVQLF